ncbi:MAG: hypothetical protein KDD42_00420 [Bdellovibrionales bacterium]|nr:hypothetical protein [Bdellovibrionales bacterium]
MVTTRLEPNLDEDQNSKAPVERGAALSLISVLLNSLAHRLRTPLSVITNELSYLSNIEPQHDLSASQGKCRELAETLKEICSLSEAELHRRELTLEEMVSRIEKVARARGLTAEVKISGEDLQSGVTLDPDRFQALLERLIAVMERPAGAAAKMILARKEQQFKLKLEFPGKLPNQDQACLITLTEYLLVAGGADLFWGPIVDSIIAAEQGKITVNAAKTTEVILHFPVK